MVAPGPNVLSVPVSVLTTTFQVRGTLNIVGLVMTFINDEQKASFNIMQCGVTGLQNTNPAAQMSHDEMIMLKRQVHVLAFEDTPPAGIQLSARSEYLMLYTDAFALLGRWHMLPDARVNDFVDTSLSPFLPVSDLKVYPLFTGRPGLIQASPLGFVHKSQVRMYHAG